MKRIVAFILILTLWGFALADTGIDWTEYPDDELQKTADEMTEMLNEIQNEIERRNREKSEEKTLGIETDVLLASFDGYLDEQLFHRREHRQRAEQDHVRPGRARIRGRYLSVCIDGTDHDDHRVRSNADEMRARKRPFL